MSSTAQPLAWAPSLRAKIRPNFAAGDAPLRVVDLFAGCGGLTLGIAQSAKQAGHGIDVRLAVDFEQTAVDVYKANFPAANAVTASVEDFFDGELGDAPTEREIRTRAAVGETEILVGGPPCQGHSNLNNKTRRNDPKNRLYLRMARAAEILEPTFVVIENVPSVRLDTAGVVQTTYEHLETLGYTVAAATISLHALGVAQKRKRHVILATKAAGIDPAEVLAALAGRTDDPSFDLAWAIRDLEKIASPAGYDIPSAPTKTNLARIQYLFEHDLTDLPNEQRPVCHQNATHSYKSMYGRLAWGEPAQTITSGFGSMGQGRYVHPGQMRTLTAHEAARIQGFPDYFRFTAVTGRGALATMIGNAVPPALMREVTSALMSSLRPAVEEDTPPEDALEPALALAG
ncbi:DNA cytosine methyltransferase [Microbacterium maritypicum]